MYFNDVETAHTCFVTFTNMFDGWNVAHIYHERSALGGLFCVDVQYDQIDTMSLRFSNQEDLNYCDNAHKIHQ